MTTVTTTITIIDIIIIIYIVVVADDIIIIITATIDVVIAVTISEDITAAIARTQRAIVGTSPFHCTGWSTGRRRHAGTIPRGSRGRIVWTSQMVIHSELFSSGLWRSTRTTTGYHRGHCGSPTHNTIGPRRGRSGGRTGRSSFWWRRCALLLSPYHGSRAVLSFQGHIWQGRRGSRTGKAGLTGLHHGHGRLGVMILEGVKLEVPPFDSKHRDFLDYYLPLTGIAFMVSQFLTRIHVHFHTQFTAAT